MAQSTLYIHIGTPKTGTTALQGFLAKNRKTLQEHGAVFPDFGLVYKGVAKNRNAHFLVATKDPFHAKEMGVCMKILKQQAALYPKILISDESIWTFYGHPDVETAPFWKKLKEMLDGMDLDLKVIVYLRRQDQYAFSYYAQKIKEAEEIRCFRDYMLVDGPARARLDYEKELGLIASAIGKENLIVRKYDRDGFGGSRGTIQSDFLEAVGLEYTPDLLEGNPDKNVTFHGQVLEAKRFYNMMEHPDLTRHEIVAAFHGAETDHGSIQLYGRPSDGGRKRAEIRGLEAASRKAGARADGADPGPFPERPQGEALRMNLYLIRHGETAKNRQKLLQGRSDVPLNENGRKQARQAARFFEEKGIRFDRVYASPLIRAVETARIIAGEDAEILTDDRLLEMDYGPWEGCSLERPAPELIRFFSDFVHNPAPQGMESLDHVKERMGLFLEMLKETAPSGGDRQGNILASTHAIALKGALEELMPESRGS